MTVGIVDANRIFKSAAKGVGLPVVYVGSKTGRERRRSRRHHGLGRVRRGVGREAPYRAGRRSLHPEKLLLEACLELMQEDTIVAIQDIGAGLTSSSVEMADKGAVGIELDLDYVPMRETGMTAYEMMLSESQERMLMVLKTSRESIAESACSENGSSTSR